MTWQRGSGVSELCCRPSVGVDCVVFHVKTVVRQSLLPYVTYFHSHKTADKMCASLRDLDKDILSSDADSSDLEESDIKVDVAREPVACLVDGVPMDPLDVYQLRKLMR